MTNEDRKELTELLQNISLELLALDIESFTERLRTVLLELDTEEWGKENFDEFIRTMDAVELENEFEHLLTLVRQVNLVKQDLGLT